MGRPLSLVATIVLLWTTPAAADPLSRWSAHISEASARFGIPADWIRRVMLAESGGRTSLEGKPIVSPAGAMGLMQLMPDTWQEVRATLSLGPDPHEPRDNILAGTFYLRAMYDRFGYPGLFGAYNAGPARYAEHLTSGRPLPKETVVYIETVDRGGFSALPSKVVAAPPPPPLFAVLKGQQATAPFKDKAGDGTTRSLFVPLSGSGSR